MHVERYFPFFMTCVHSNFGLPMQGNALTNPEKGVSQTNLEVSSRLDHTAETAEVLDAAFWNSLNAEGAKQEMHAASWPNLLRPEFEIRKEFANRVKADLEEKHRAG